MAPQHENTDTSPAASPWQAAQLERFTSRLIGVARAHLDARLQHKIEPEDVVQSVYKSFLVRYGDGAIEQRGAQSLWNLLTLITLRKCADRVRYFHADCRDVGREAVPDPARPEGWRAALGREPTPELAAMFTETVEQLLRGVPADDRPILELTLQGFSAQEVSQQLGRAERSVRRLRERMRLHLEQLQEASNDLDSQS